MALRIIIGSYEHVLYGYDATIKSRATDESNPTDHGASAELTARYVYESHNAPITALAVSGKILVSGSHDEMIKFVPCHGGTCPTSQ